MEKSTLTFNGTTYEFIQKDCYDFLTHPDTGPINTPKLHIHINGVPTKVSEFKTHLPNTIEECLEYIQYFEL